MGEPYTLWAVTETPEDGAIEEKDAEQTFDVSVYSNIPEEARSEVRETIDYSDEDGFAGTLTLADLTVSETAQEDGTYQRARRAGTSAGDPHRRAAAHHAGQPGAVHLHLYADDPAPSRRTATPARSETQAQGRAARPAEKAEDLCALQRYCGGRKGG